jgi:hypothetical protein
VWVGKHGLSMTPNKPLRFSLFVFVFARAYRSAIASAIFLSLRYRCTHKECSD